MINILKLMLPEITKEQESAAEKWLEELHLEHARVNEKERE